MIIGNQEHAHAPLIVESYKSVPAKNVAALIELAANDDRLIDTDNSAMRWIIQEELCDQADIPADETLRLDLFAKVQTVIDTLHAHEIVFYNLSKENLSMDERKLRAIQDEVAHTTTNAVDGAGINPKHYYTHHPLQPVGNGSTPFAPKRLPSDYAFVSISWPRITTTTVVWGEAKQEILPIPALAHPSGLFFEYENAAKLQLLLRSDAIKNSGLIFGYAAVEPLRISPNGHQRRGLDAFYPPHDDRDAVRHALPTQRSLPSNGL